MVDGVELTFGHHPHQMWELQGQHAIGFEENRKPGDEIVELGYMRKHVVSNQQIGPDAALGDSARGASSKEFYERRYAPLLGRFRDIGGRLDTGDRNAGLLEVLKQIAVVAGDLHDS